MSSAIDLLEDSAVRAWLAVTMGLLGFGTGFGYFVCMLLWPLKVRDFRESLRGRGRIPVRNRGWRPAHELESRVAGALGTVLMGWALFAMIRGVFFNAHPVVHAGVAPPLARHGRDEFELGMGILMTLLGVIVIVWPNLIIQWLIWSKPHRESSEDIFQKGIWPIRIFAAIWILAALQAVFAGLRLR